MLKTLNVSLSFVLNVSLIYVKFVGVRNVIQGMDLLSPQTKSPNPAGETTSPLQDASRFLFNKFTFVLIVLCLSCISLTTTAEELPLSLAKHLSTQGNYDAAITEYKRFLFFHADDARVGEIYYRMGLAYRAQGLWTEAVAMLQTAIYHAVDSESKSEYQLALAVTHIATQDYDLAQLELIKVTLRAPAATLHRRALFLRGVAYVYQFRWHEARDVLKNWSTDEKLDALLAAAMRKPQKSAALARILSTILPGAGQVYAGKWRDGLNALALNGALGFLTVDAALDRHYTDALLWGGLVFWRYYQGNTFRAGEAAEQVNQQQARHTAEMILQRLQEIAESRKPR